MADDCPRVSDLGPLRAILQKHLHDQVRKRAYTMAVDIHRMDASDSGQVTEFRRQADSILRLLESLAVLSDDSVSLTGTEIPGDLLPPLDNH